MDANKYNSFMFYDNFNYSLKIWKVNLVLKYMLMDVLNQSCFETCITYVFFDIFDVLFVVKYLS